MTTGRENTNRQNTGRTKARRRALDILYEADLRGQDAQATLADRIAAADPPVRPFTIDLVQGVVEHGRTIDDVIVASLASASTWTIDRMPAVDRGLARIAVFELLHTDTPVAVVANEAVGLAAELSTDGSPAFLNALLDRAGKAAAGWAAESPSSTE